MFKKILILSALALAVSPLPQVLRAADPARPNAAEIARQQFDLRVHLLEERLRSGDPDREQKALDELRSWVADDVRAHDGPEMLLRLQGALMTPKHYADFLTLLNLALPNVASGRLDQRRDIVVLQCRCQFRLRQYDVAITAFKKLLAADAPGAARQAGDDAIAALLAGQRYNELDDLGLQIILARPEDTGRVESVLQAQIKAFSIEKRFDKALAASKQLFAVSSMAHTGDALLTLSRQFALARPEDKTIVERFRKEQIDGAAPPSAPSVAAASSSSSTTLAVALAMPAASFADGDAPRPSAMLAQVKIDPTPYAAALKDILDDDFDSQMRRGNLLLLMDQPRDAKAAFERAASLAEERQLSTAFEAIARAIKAQDGTIGRANAYLTVINESK